MHNISLITKFYQSLIDTMTHLLVQVVVWHTRQRGADDLGTVDDLLFWGMQQHKRGKGALRMCEGALRWYVILTPWCGAVRCVEWGIVVVPAHARRALSVVLHIPCATTPFPYPTLHLTPSTTPAHNTPPPTHTPTWMAFSWRLRSSLANARSSPRSWRRSALFQASSLAICWWRDLISLRQSLARLLLSDLSTRASRLLLRTWGQEMQEGLCACE